MSQNKESVLLEVSESIAVITLNRPERHNAINQALLIQLYEAVENAGSREDVGVIILTGKGKSFCAGVDLEAVHTEKLFDIQGEGRELPEIFLSCGKPIIGAVNGHAITGGLEMALCCDFLIASSRAVFIDSHAKLGIHPGWGVSQLLQQAVGRRRAKQMSFTGQPVSALQALEWGLVNEVVPGEILMTRVREIAGHICSMDRDMLGKIKSLVESGDRMSLAEGLSRERKGFISFLEDPGKRDASPFKRGTGKA
ncbi:enoyl-CoA hydratase [Desulfospira joergensenii]|uniref:enoyl-CoA hydratase n=1 Tax=Desulfospira joergensenii TaxID=53329 RepID=UPI0003B50BF5|nr:enoyl-CoA hydratase [Desulfospira joergensenii]